MDFRCVECGFHIKTLYVQYSPGNIRLMKCENCKAVADEYIECEAMILLIDLILHKEKAYRHLFYNMFNQESMNFEGLLWKLGFSFLVLDTYRIFVLSKSEEDLGGLSKSFDASSWSFVKMMVELVFGNLICACTLLVGTRFFLNASIRCRDVLLAVLVSSYFKVFLIAMMVWEFPPSVLFVVDVFVLSSNVVALKVLSGNSVSTTKCLGICLSAVVSKFLVSWLLNIHPLAHSTFAEMQSTLIEMLRQKDCQPDIWTMNSTLRAFGGSGQIETMEKCYEKFQTAGIQLNIKTFNILLDSYGKTANYEKMSAVMEYLQKYHFSWTPITYNVVIDAFGKAGDIKQMEYLFRPRQTERIEPNCVTPCSIVRAYGQAENSKKIKGCFCKYLKILT